MGDWKIFPLTAYSSYTVLFLKPYVAGWKEKVTNERIQRIDVPKWKKHLKKQIWNIGLYVKDLPVKLSTSFYVLITTLHEP